MLKKNTYTTTKGETFEYYVDFPKTFDEKEFYLRISMQIAQNKYKAMKLEHGSRFLGEVSIDDLLYCTIEELKNKLDKYQEEYPNCNYLEYNEESGIEFYEKTYRMESEKEVAARVKMAKQSIFSRYVNECKRKESDKGLLEERIQKLEKELSEAKEKLKNQPVKTVIV